MGKANGRGILASVGCALLALLTTTACGDEKPAGPASEAGGTPSIGGSSGAMAGSASGSGGSSGVAGSSAESCPGPAPEGSAVSGRLDLPVAITINGDAAVIGEPGRTRAGRETKLSLFKFFLSKPTLIAASGAEARAKFVGETGQPLPYGLVLIDADDPATQKVRLAVDSGNYVALRFGVGVPAPCNGGDPTTRVFPLNADSDMYWPWGAQYMFLRVEGTARSTEADAWNPFVYHLGFDPAYATVTLDAELSVEPVARADAPTLALDVDRLLERPEGSEPSGGHLVPEGWIADNIEQNQVFSLK